MPAPKKRARRAADVRDSRRELWRRFYTARNAVIEKFNLDLSDQKRGFSADTLWLAHHLFGRYYKRYIYDGDGSRRRKKKWTEWLKPSPAMLYGRVQALEHLLTLPVSLIEDDRREYYERTRPGRRREIGDV